MEEILLSITIPTFNRRRQLLEQVTRLLPQLTTNCELIVIDNASEKSPEVTLRQIMSDYPDVKFSFIRNRFNLGMSGNIIKCIENAGGEWFWILGDDDPVEPDAISKIINEIKLNPNACCILFQNKDRDSFGVTDDEQCRFLATLDFGHFNQMSEMVLRTNCHQERLGLAYDGASTLSPHTIASFGSYFQSSGPIIYSDEIILSVAVASAGATWNRLRGFVRVYRILESTALSERHRLLLARALDIGFGGISSIKTLALFTVVSVEAGVLTKADAIFYWREYLCSYCGIRKSNFLLYYIIKALINSNILRKISIGVYFKVTKRDMRMYVLPTLGHRV